MSPTNSTKSTLSKAENQDLVILYCHKQSLLSTDVRTNCCDTRFNGVYLMFDSFWEVYYELLTILNVAQRVLSIPATNTCAERIFLDSENTIKSCRRRFEISKVNQLLFMHRNLSTLRELFPPSVEQIKIEKIVALQQHQ